jgi:hypothetical protein
MSIRKWFDMPPEHVPLRTPWLLRKHSGKTGVIVYGHWVGAVPGDDWSWMGVSVGVDYRWGMGFHLNTRWRCTWISLAPGEHHFQFGNHKTKIRPANRGGARNLVYECDLTLHEGDIWLIAFTPPVNGFRLWPKREAAWAIRQLR